MNSKIKVNLEKLLIGMRSKYLNNYYDDSIIENLFYFEKDIVENIENKVVYKKVKGYLELLELLEEEYEINLEDNLNYFRLYNLRYEEVKEVYKEVKEEIKRLMDKDMLESLEEEGEL